ncbi:MAG: hypothetical protein SGPRY_002267 [Prymnesium sp.]
MRWKRKHERPRHERKQKKRKGEKRLGKRKRASSSSRSSSSESEDRRRSVVTGRKLKLERVESREEQARREAIRRVWVG